MDTVGLRTWKELGALSWESGWCCQNGGVGKCVCVWGAHPQYPLLCLSFLPHGPLCFLTLFQ
jgi:hypothetical protein